MSTIPLQGPEREQKHISQELMRVHTINNVNCYCMTETAARVKGSRKRLRFPLKFSKAQLYLFQALDGKINQEQKDENLRQVTYLPSSLYEAERLKPSPFLLSV